MMDNGTGSAVLEFTPDPQPVKKKSVRAITWLIIQKTIKKGFNVYLSCSKTSNSRYLRVYLGGGRKVIIRISDHPEGNFNPYASRKRLPAGREVRRYCDYDIYTDTERLGAMDYLEFLEIWKKILKRTRRRRLMLSNRPFLKAGHLSMGIIENSQRQVG